MDEVEEEFGEELQQKNRQNIFALLTKLFSVSVNCFIHLAWSQGHFCCRGDNNITIIIEGI